MNATINEIYENLLLTTSRIAQLEEQVKALQHSINQIAFNDPGIHVPLVDSFQIHEKFCTHRKKNKTYWANIYRYSPEDLIIEDIAESEEYAKEQILSDTFYIKTISFEIEVE